MVVHLDPGNNERRLTPLFDRVRRASAELYPGYTDEELALIMDLFEKAVPTLREQTTRLSFGFNYSEAPLITWRNRLSEFLVEFA